jgi:hypothetical protein
VNLRWSAVTPAQRRLFQAAAPCVPRWGGYLAGGTAVALRFGHRRSVDLDYFTRKKVDAGRLARDVRSIAKAAGVSYELEDGNKKGSFGARVGRVSLSVLHGYALIDEPEVLDSCPIATPRDLAAMKIFAIGGRSEKKDFVDLHEILLFNPLTVEELMQLFARKFRRHLKPGQLQHFRRSLTDFALADSSLMPTMLKTAGAITPPHDDRSRADHPAARNGGLESAPGSR